MRVAFVLCSFLFLGALAIPAHLPPSLNVDRPKTRPPSPSFCQAMFPFCPGQMPFPSFEDEDTWEIWHLQAPVWEFKFGDLGKRLNVWHDAVGLKNIRTGLNYTMEWYELFQFFNCTFPHVVRDPGSWVADDIIWCNQGAMCFRPGIDDRHWYENGTMAKVAEVPGTMFRRLTEYLKSDNQTDFIYQAFTVRDKPNGNLLFPSHDCADFSQRTFNKLGQMGAKFNTSFVPRFDRLEMYAAEVEEITDPDSMRSTLVEFYDAFQAHQSPLQLIRSLISMLADAEEKLFYLYVDFKYYKLRLRHPYIKMVYAPFPLPSQQ
eukprot:JP446397.1.p1 GENE.JP446397.1~~JP446397.1.p1  ORF type:complete len:318 (+),score=58.96 JP446397.1:21-974(+)